MLLVMFRDFRKAVEAPVIEGVDEFVMIDLRSAGLIITAKPARAELQSYCETGVTKDILRSIVGSDDGEPKVRAVRSRA
jgi:hypothetical protein